MLNGQGTVCLVGSGEFLPGSKKLDQTLLATLKERPKVVVLPTASTPDGKDVFARWGKMGIEYFGEMNVETEAVNLSTRADADSKELAGQIASANFVYLSGGKPSYLVDTLHDTLCWQAIRTVFQRGGVVAGCSAGAMALAGFLPRIMFGRAQPALGLTPELIVIPHFDEIPSWLTGVARFSGKKGSGLTVVGVEAYTGLVRTGKENWRAVGQNKVTVFSPQGRKRYADGEIINTLIAI